MSDLGPVWRRGELPLPAEGRLLLRAEDWLWGPSSERPVLSEPCILRSAVCDLGSVEPLDFGLIHALAALARELPAAAIHEELGFRSLEDRSLFCALPLPRNEESVGRVASRLRLVRRLLPVPLRLQWLAPPPKASSAMGEEEFLKALRVAADCEIVAAPVEGC
ncbi:MAG: hypothetical protein CSA62_02125 [Planctomycetota bacterium]|nr:MAG: hypothetical protein CSA62_02125 [Planctomycetota bacterium]